MTEALVPFHVPDIGRGEEQAVLETLRSGWLTTGSRVQEFERRFAERVGARHAVAVSSCTAALHLALEAAGVSAGDEVIVPTWTFAATAEVVVYQGAKPVLVDIDPKTLNVTAPTIEAAITDRTRAVIPVHFGGQPCDMTAIGRVALDRGLTVVEDAAHAFPAQWDGQPIGSIGDFTCFSFYPTKNITTGEGGMITVRDEAAADQVRMVSLHGISKDAWKRYAAGGSWYYQIRRLGYKYNMTDLTAAIGIEQLKRLDSFCDARQRHVRRYEAALAEIPEVSRPCVLPGVDHAWHLYVILLELDLLRIDRNRFIELLTERGIGTSVHFIPLHLHEYYQKNWGYSVADFPHASQIYERTISLPLYPMMPASDVDRVIDAIAGIVDENRA